MKTSESLAHLATALAAAQAELRAVAKDSVNPHFKNRYASLDTILETIRPTLTKHGLALVQGATAPHADENGVVRSFVVETMLLHKSGEFITNAAVMPLAKADPQGAGGAMTYGRRYGVAALLALATEEDDDGNVASARPAAPVQARPAAPPAPRPAAKPAAPDMPVPIAEAVAALGGDFTPVDPACPSCGGRMWDNREGKRNPKAPDFKCRDKQCDGVIWPPKAGAKPAAAARPVSVPPANEYDDDLPF